MAHIQLMLLSSKPVLIDSDKYSVMSTNFRWISPEVETNTHDSSRTAMM